MSTTYNNGFAVKVGNSKALSRAVQSLLFKHGYKWYSSGAKENDEAVGHYGNDPTGAAIRAEGGTLTYADAGCYLHGGVYEVGRIFDAATEFGKLVEYLSKPELPPIKLGQYEVEFLPAEKAFRVGCQRVTLEQIDQIRARLVEEAK